MANEFTVRTSLQLKNGFTDYQSRPTSFFADQESPGGPTPGQILADLDGTIVDLSQLGIPGKCFLINLDPDNYIIYGPYVADLGIFVPLFELGPGESVVPTLYRELGARLGTGTGTEPVTTGVHLYVKGTVAPCQVRVDAFNK